jgi:hypothetical protein
VPTLLLPRWDLRVELWVTVDYDEDAVTPAGFARYVATDQVRFTAGSDDAALPLAAVPPLVFSEVMRDVDLFVGVCSVGNDPTWYDSGPDRWRPYWDRFAFGALSASAETRRAALERLLPRLAIGPRCTIAGRFLVVRGDVRDYKIHLGSGNILMEPNDEYLCIVGGRDPDVRGRVYLPFEGDHVLALILSKALLLARDDKIEDRTITAQIRAAR